MKKIKQIVAGTEKKAKNMMEHVVQAMDQDDDGKFDLKDVAIMGSAVSQAVKKGTRTLKAGVDEKKREMDQKLLRPIFPEDLKDTAFRMPKFIQVTARDKKYSEKEVCHGSVGYYSDQKGLRIVHIFQDALDVFGLSFYPDCDSEFYYVDPSNSSRYISLDEYFGYLKIARVNELQKIAQDLGAKHFKVIYKEEKISFAEKKTKTNGEGKVPGAGTVKAAGDHSTTQTQYSKVEISAESTFPGHGPVQPELKYLVRDSNIQSLIQLRMDSASPIMHQTYMLKLSQTCGMKESEAEKIDAVLKGMKLSGNATLASEAKNEARRYLEYEIDF